MMQNIQNIFPPKKSLKNYIINIILEKQNNQGIEIKQIKNQLSKNYQLSRTYQGIHKILVQLKEEDIIQYEDHKWKLNEHWVESITTKFGQWNNTEEIPTYNKQIKSISFETMGKAFEFILKNIESGTLKNSGENIFITHVKNLAFFIPNKKEKEILKQLAKNTKCYILVENNNFINRLCTKYLKSLGWNIYLGIPRSTPHTITIYGNTLYNTYAKNDLTSYMTSKYKKIKNISSKEALKLFDILKEDKQFTITFTFETDENIVELTKKYLLKLIQQ